MWVFLSDSFLSIVAHRKRRNHFLVRARQRSDIEAVFPAAKITEGGGADYEFRAIVKRKLVEDAMLGELRRIDYPNFKASVRDRPLHDLYLKVWTVMMGRGRPAPLAQWSADNHWADKHWQTDSLESADNP